MCQAAHFPSLPTATADTANPLVGKILVGACTDCVHTPTEDAMTSLAGADYCTIPWFDITCKTAGARCSQLCVGARGGAARPRVDSGMPAHHPTQLA